MEKDTKWFIGIFIVFFLFMCIASSRSGTTKDYTVKPGDSWYSIAEAQNVDIEELLRVNNANKETMLYPDQVIKIPVHNNDSQASSEDDTADNAEKPQWMENNTV